MVLFGFAFCGLVIVVGGLVGFSLFFPFGSFDSPRVGEPSLVQAPVRSIGGFGADLSAILRRLS
jgi:hypothetical protein